MTTTINIDTDINKEMKKVELLIKRLEEAKEKAKLLQFVGIKEVCEATGWTPAAVQKLFNRPDFPCCDYGRGKKAEINAVIKFFDVARRKKDFCD